MDELEAHNDDQPTERIPQLIAQNLRPDADMSAPSNEQDNNPAGTGPADDSDIKKSNGDLSTAVIVIGAFMVLLFGAAAFTVFLGPMPYYFPRFTKLLGSLGGLGLLAYCNKKLFDEHRHWALKRTDHAYWVPFVIFAILAAVSLILYIQP